MISYKKLLLISDLHFGISANSLLFQNIQKEYYEDFLIPFLKQQDKDTALFILGDVFDCRHSINVGVLNYVYNLLKTISNIIDVYIIAGNHDLFSENSLVSSLISIENCVKKVYYTPEMVTVNNCNILLLPYNTSDKPYSEIISNYNNIDYIFTHCDIASMKFSDSVKIPNSDSNKVINEDCFKVCKKIISGHIHKRQETNKVIYLGSPYSLTFNDVNDVKGVYELNVETDVINFFENPIDHKFKKLSMNDLLNMSDEQFLEFANNSFVSVSIPQMEKTKISYSKYYKLLEDSKTNCHKLKFNFETISNLTESVLHNATIDGNPVMIESTPLVDSIEEYVNECVPNIYRSRVNNNIKELINNYKGL